ncbi:MAG TPA: secretin N-terminal domain-containing protein [Candidatus Eisenbacteria bacterium]|nr:secretin N-terminal domain-containing protein [Candidatus Eisenbacteria bacterium]
MAIRLSTFLGLCFLALGLSAGQVPAQLPSQAPAASPPPRLVSLDAADADLSRVLQILAERGGFNLITGPGVAAGRISVRMKDVPVDQAVNLVVRAAGLGYERIGNSILVADARALKEETGLSSYVVELKYADANEVMAALKDLVQTVQVDKGGNRLIVVTSPRIISEVEEIVEVMDVPTRQVMLEARIVEVSTDNLMRLGIDWDQLNRRSYTFVEGNYDSISGSGTGAISGLRVFPNTPGTHDIFKLNNFSRIADVYRVVIDLAITDGNARVLANPKLTTLNGKEASILIGSRIPYEVTGTAFAGNAAAPITEIVKEEVGIKLRITPLINADGYITTTIAPEVSTVVAFRGANNDLPVVATREASTTVRLKDGASVIIGGLLSEDKTSTVTKVPVLGQIPGIGLLFQHHDTQSSKKDLVIEVTPHILPE